MGIHEEEYRFCPLCGRESGNPDRENRGSIRFSCSHCGFTGYRDPKLVVCTILVSDQKILLVKRANPPQRGTWVLPGGYVDRSEELKSAAARETNEECGLEVKVHDLVGVYSYSGNPVVLVVYQAEYLSGELNINQESLEAGWFGPAEIPWDEIGFQSTRDVLEDYLNGKKDERRPSENESETRKN